MSFPFCQRDLLRLIAAITQELVLRCIVRHGQRVAVWSTATAIFTALLLSLHDHLSHIGCAGLPGSGDTLHSSAELRELRLDVF